jgi:hypothetical protein
MEKHFCAIQLKSDRRTVALYFSATQGNKKAFDVRPFDCPVYGIGKNSLQGFPVLFIHRAMIAKNAITEKRLRGLAVQATEKHPISTVRYCGG